MGYLASGLDKGIPFNSGKEPAEEVRVKVGFAESEVNICKLERKIVGSAALCVACKQVMCNQANHRW